jgi:conjugal transfer pilus assembly protein TraF
MASLAKTHGVLFFYRSDCEFCKLQAPIMQMLNQRYGIEVLAVSVDGGGIREFPNAKLDNGISLVVTQGRGVQTVPALFLVSRDQKQVLQLGSGVLAMDEIIERARVLTTTQVGEAF